MPKILLIGCGGVFLFALVMIAVVPAFLPSSYQCQSATIIAAPQEDVFAAISDFHKWGVWWPWNPEVQSGIQSSIEGEPGTVGHEWKFNDGRGDGRTVITNANVDTGIHFDMVMGKFRASGQILTKPVTGGIQVTMSMGGDVGYVERLGVSTLVATIEEEFARGLTRLEKLVEEGEVEATDAPAEGTSKK